MQKKKKRITLSLCDRIQNVINITEFLQQLLDKLKPLHLKAALPIFPVIFF